MSRKLHYFHVNGLAEPIRYIFHYGKVKFEDIRYDRKDWPIKSVKDSLPYGQMPLYEEGNRTLNQSLAIARYAASQCGLLPSDTWEQAVLDAVVFTIYDFWTKVLPYIKETDPAKKQALKREILEEHVDFFFSRFEKELKAKNGHFGGKAALLMTAYCGRVTCGKETMSSSGLIRTHDDDDLTWADFILVGIVEATNLFLGTELEKNYPSISSLMHKIRSLPGVKEYVATRKPYVV